MASLSTPAGQGAEVGLEQGPCLRDCGVKPKDGLDFSKQAPYFLGPGAEFCISALAFPSHRIYLPIHRFGLEVARCRAENVRVKNLWSDPLDRIQLS